MPDDLVMHLSANSSSNPSDPSLQSKMAKLEARMVGKSSSFSGFETALQSNSELKFAAAEPEGGDSTSDSDDDNGSGFLVQHNTNKRRKLEEDEQPTLQHDEVATNGVLRVTESADLTLNMDESNRKRQGRGRGARGRGAQSGVGRGRGSKASDQAKLSVSSSNSLPLSNGHTDISLQKEKLTKEHIGKTKEQEEISLLKRKVAKLEEEVLSKSAKLEEELSKSAKLEEELSKSRKEGEEARSKARAVCLQLEKELEVLKEKDQQMKTKQTQQLKVQSDLLISISKAERQEARTKVRQESLRLGNVGVLRVGTAISEIWEDGQTLKDINAHLKSLLETKETIERHRKLLKKRQPDKGETSDSENGVSEEEYLIQEEMFKSRLLSIKREEENCIRERDRYELEKARLMREMKRIRDEDESCFNNFQILNQRYALLNLLGKGGFSEVYKAYDFVEHRYVACKLHGLNARWSEEKKQSYVRHAVREYNIHKTLVHPHIVRLWDIFEIDHNTFCTVLEYCSGKDLDVVLKATPVLSERDARIILVQIFQGLIYLNKRPQKIIHYDLKPGNVLFDEVGVAKVTDFGLSKILEDDTGSQGMELTSQGAGTYWYLPPECFVLSRTPLISSKVDVWSVGVMFYQMLFGKRPFGHEQTQERILREDTIINARKVEFPSKPSVSNDAKELIRKCLTYNQAERPDVLTIAQDPYLSCAKR